MTMVFASKVLPAASTVLGPKNFAGARIRSTPRSLSVSSSESGMPSIISFSRSMSAAQSSEGLPTLMQWTWACPISCRACAAATSTFFGVQPRLGQVPPRSRSSIRATFKSRFPRRHGDAERGIAAADDRHVIGFARHLDRPSRSRCANCRGREGGKPDTKGRGRVTDRDGEAVAPRHSEQMPERGVALDVRVRSPYAARKGDG